jgi:hypothetical protein
MKQIFAYEEQAGRIELFIRIVYSFVVGIVLMIYGFIAGICMLIQFLVILILGRRSRSLSDFYPGVSGVLCPYPPVYLLYDG